MSRWLSSSGAAGAATLLSRILGFVRESAYAAFMGTGPVADAFFLAFQIPNLFRRLLGEGALSSAFIPVFKETERKEGVAAAWRVGLACTWAVFLACTVICVVLLGTVTLLILFSNIDIHTELMFRLMRWMLPYLPLVCVAAGFIGMLNARNHFFLPALGATMLNVAMLASIWWLAPRFGAELHQQVYALALGVVVAGVAQAAFQVPSLVSEGFRFRWLNPWKEPAVREVARRMGPSVIGVAAFQINTVLCQAFAYSHGREIISSFNYAVRLMELPQGVVGISLATVMLTELSTLAVDKKYPEFRSTLTEGLQQLIFLTLLPLVLLLTLSEPIVRLLFERGQFKAASTAQVSLMILCLSPSLMAFSLNNVLARAFYALGDTRTPMRISLAAIVTNFIAAFISVSLMPKAGLAIANSVSASMQCFLLFYALKRKQPKFDLPALFSPVRRMAVAGLAAAGTAAATLWLWHRWVGHQGLPGRLGATFVPMALAAAGYFLAATSLGIREAADVLAVVARRKRRASSEAGPSQTSD
ncbi:MAG: murein biosynthesis integral membrane protein MurJ [Verrucomicrobiota bacterium]